jgi:signal recognition particle subunit SRP54
MGPLQGVLKLIPGLGSQLEGLGEVDERQLARVEAIVLSMTPQERRFPHVIDGSRRQRIAKGSGTTVQDVNKLLEARKQMAKAMKQLGKGKLPALPGMVPGQNGPAPARSATKKKKKSRRKKSKSRSRR